MVAYMIGVLPLIKRPKSAYPDITHPWYAEKYGALGNFNSLKKSFSSLKRSGPAWGYYSNSTEIILIVHLNNPEVGNCLVLIMGVRFTWEHVILVVISGMMNPKEIG